MSTGITFRNAKIEISVDDGATWTNISGQTNSLTVGGGDREIGAFFDAQNDVPTLAVGKRSELELTVRVKYTENDLEAHGILEDAYENKTPITVRYSPRGGAFGEREYTFSAGYVKSNPYPGQEVESGDPIRVEFTIIVPAVALTTPLASPLMISGVLLWMIADSISGADGDAIDAWISSEGGAKTFSGTTTARPLLKKDANGINNKNTVLFDGVNDILVNTSAFLTGTQGTVFAIVRLTALDLAGLYTVLASSDELGVTRNVQLAALKGSASPYIDIYQRNNDTRDENTGDSTLIAGLPYRMMWKSSGTAYTLKVNDSLQTLTTLGLNSGDWWDDSIGKDNTSIGAVKTTSIVNFFKGEIAEIIVYDRALTAEETSKIEEYLDLRYGVYSLTAFGDSVVAGQGASDASHRWVNIVSTALGMTLTNSGIGSTILQNTVQNTVANIGFAAVNNGRDTYGTRVTAKTSNFVLILYGLNDLRLNDVAITADLFESDLGEIVDGIIADGILPERIVIGSPSYIPESSYALYAPWDGGSLVKHYDYVARCASVAAAKGATYIDVYQWMVDHGGDALLDVDGIHPNDAGHAEIAAAFLSVMT